METYGKDWKSELSFFLDLSSKDSDSCHLLHLQDMEKLNLSPDVEAAILHQSFSVLILLTLRFVVQNELQLSESQHFEDPGVMHAVVQKQLVHREW